MNKFNKNSTGPRGREESHKILLKGCTRAKKIGKKNPLPFPTCKDLLLQIHQSAQIVLYIE